MKLLDILAKLGILRWGAKSEIYHSSKERPAEFMMDDVFNADRDLIKTDAAHSTQQQPEPEQP